MSRLSTSYQQRFASLWPAACGLAIVVLLGAACAQDPAKLKIAISSPSDGDTIHVGSEISFASSVKGGEKPIKLSWKFDSKDDGDVSPSTSHGKNPDSIVFSTPGKYKVVLSATDDKLQDASDSIEIVASYDALTLSITSPDGDQAIAVGDSVEFTAEVASGEDPVAVEWNFDSTGVGGADVETSSGLAAGSVTYSEPGEYTVTLSATDNAGQTTETSVIITVSYEQFVRNFKATSGDTQITLTWDLPSDPDYQTVIVRRSDVDAPTEPDDPADEAVGTLSATSPLTDTSVTNDTGYFYAVFAHDADGNYGAGVTATATPADVTAPDDVANFTATPFSANQIDLSWNNPADPDFSQVIVIMSTTGCPSFPTDNTSIYDNTGTSYSKMGLTTATKYWFTAFAYDEVPNYSGGVCVDATTP